jgi:hypothetical protein
VKKFLLSAVALAAFAVPAAANAAAVFVGSWDVYNGPSWSNSPPNGPLAYTGQEAAALLFGGSASDYAISTVDNTVANINNKAWYDVIGVGGNIFAENYSNKYLGQFYGPTSGYNCCGGAYTNINAASAYVQDNLQGANAINFAFRIDRGGVPEPAAWAMMLAGFGLVGSAMRRREKVAVTFA